MAVLGLKSSWLAFNTGIVAGFAVAFYLLHSAPLPLPPKDSPRRATLAPGPALLGALHPPLPGECHPMAHGGGLMCLALLGGDTWAPELGWGPHSTPASSIY